MLVARSKVGMIYNVIFCRPFLETLCQVIFREPLLIFRAESTFKREMG